MREEAAPSSALSRTWDAKSRHRLRNPRAPGHSVAASPSGPWSSHRLRPATRVLACTRIGAPLLRALWRRPVAVRSSKDLLSGGVRVCGRAGHLRPVLTGSCSPARTGLRSGWPTMPPGVDGLALHHLYRPWPGWARNLRGRAGRGHTLAPHTIKDLSSAGSSGGATCSANSRSCVHGYDPLSFAARVGDLGRAGLPRTTAPTCCR